jgi:Activator of Hsp90 ATPase homolog 1-like protein
VPCPHCCSFVTLFATTFVGVVRPQRSAGSEPIERVLPLGEPSGRKNRRSFESFLTARFQCVGEPRRNVEGKLPCAGSAVAGDDAIVSEEDDKMTVGRRQEIRLEIRIDAAPETVFALLSEPAQMQTWLAEAVDAEARPGGVFRISGPSGTSIEGRYLV